MKLHVFRVKATYFKPQKKEEKKDGLVVTRLKEGYVVFDGDQWFIGQEDVRGIAVAINNFFWTRRHMIPIFCSAPCKIMYYPSQWLWECFDLSAEEQKRFREELARLDQMMSEDGNFRLD